jgi:hypothetical protein
MSRLSLPTELVSLVNYVEINKSGWLDTTLQRLIIGVIWLSGKALTLKEIVDELSENCHVSPGILKIKTQIDLLCSSDTLLHLPEGSFKISGKSLNEFETDLEKVEIVTNKAKMKFQELLNVCCPTLNADQTWSIFTEKLLIPLVREMGVRTYELISQAKGDVNSSASYTKFLQHFDRTLHEGLRKTVISFLDPTNRTIREFVLLYLNAYFFVEASNLSKKNLDSLASSSAKKQIFTLFLDTNFIFSVIGLDDSTTNEAARSLLELIDKLRNYIDIRLYVLPITIDETKRVLGWHQEYLSKVNFFNNLANVALESDLDDITRKFLTEGVNAGRSINAKDYFTPYTKNLLAILKSKKIELWNDKLDSYTMMQPVIDDILNQQQFEERFFPMKKKSYEQLLHDVVMWHYTADKRKTVVESPLDANYWCVTIDYRLLGYDSFKRKKFVDAVPVCILPTTLLQLLQFWVPRTVGIEEAILGTLRLPFLFHEFDAHTEALTIRILGTLSRFENIGELHPETIKALLLNDALRQKLKLEPDEEKQIAFVKEALVDENKKIDEELRAERAKASALQKDAIRKGDTITQLTETLSTN